MDQTITTPIAKKATTSSKEKSPPEHNTINNYYLIDKSHKLKMKMQKRRNSSRRSSSLERQKRLNPSAYPGRHSRKSAPAALPCTDEGDDKGLESTDGDEPFPFFATPSATMVGSRARTEMSRKAMQAIFFDKIRPPTRPFLAEELFGTNNDDVSQTLMAQWNYALFPYYVLSKHETAPEKSEQPSRSLSPSSSYYYYYQAHELKEINPSEKNWMPKINFESVIPKNKKYKVCVETSTNVSSIRCTEEGSVANSQVECPQDAGSGQWPPLSILLSDKKVIGAEFSEDDPQSEQSDLYAKILAGPSFIANHAILSTAFKSGVSRKYLIRRSEDLWKKWLFEDNSNMNKERMSIDVKFDKEGKNSVSTLFDFV